MSSAFAPLDQVQAPVEKAPVNDSVVKLSQDTNTITGHADFLAAKNAVSDTASALLPAFDMSMFTAKDGAAVLEKGGEQAAAAPAEAKSVEVKAGDSLWKIAKEDLGGDASNKDILQHVQQIAKLNGMPDPFSAEGSHSESLVLHPGQKLQLSASDSAPAATVSDSAPAPAATVSDSAPAAAVSDSAPAPAATVSDSASGPTVTDYAPVTTRDSGPVTIDVHPSLMPMEPVTAPDLQPVAIEAPAAAQPAADNVAASTAADTQVKSTAEIGQDWDKAFNARTPGQKGDFSAVDKEVGDLVSNAYKQGGDAAVQSTMDDLNAHIATKNAGVEAIQNGNSYEIHDRMKVQGMFARSADGQDSTIGLYKELGSTVDTVNVGKGSEAVARPQDNTAQVSDSGSDDGSDAQREQAKSKGSEIGQELKSGASSEKIAEDLQSALKSGNDLSDVVNAANAQTSKMGIGAPHLELRHDRDGNPQLTMKQGLFGGTVLDVNGSDVKVGATLR